MNETILVPVSRAEKAPAYVEALRAVGVAAERIRVILPTEENRKDARRLAANAGGLVMTGGPDYHPSHYGEEEDPDADLTVYPDRDELDSELFAGAREAATPIWGICRGLQGINIFLGGTLNQDLGRNLNGDPAHWPPGDLDLLSHHVDVSDPTVPMGEILSRERAPVNSRHHQSIKDLAPSLATIATSPDGVIEGVVLDSERWWVNAVQWHPENLVALEQQRALWDRFVSVVEVRRAAHSGSGRVAAGVGLR